VKKFTSRKAAVARIWQAVQRLSPDGAQQAAPVALGKAKSLAAQDADEAADRVRLPVRRFHDLRQRRALGPFHHRDDVGLLIGARFLCALARTFAPGGLRRAARRSNPRRTPRESAATESPN